MIAVKTINSKDLQIIAEISGYSLSYVRSVLKYQQRPAPEGLEAVAKEYLATKEALKEKYGRSADVK